MTMTQTHVCVHGWVSGWEGGCFLLCCLRIPFSGCLPKGNHCSRVQIPIWAHAQYEARSKYAVVLGPFERTWDSLNFLHGECIISTWGDTRQQRKPPVFWSANFGWDTHTHTVYCSPLLRTNRNKNKKNTPTTAKTTCQLLQNDVSTRTSKCTSQPAPKPETSRAHQGLRLRVICLRASHWGESGGMFLRVPVGVGLRETNGKPQCLRVQIPILTQ